MQENLWNKKTARTTLTELYGIAEEENITVSEEKCPECKAMSVLTPRGNCYIGIDYEAMKAEREERQYLAHDIGHCVAGAFYNPYSPYTHIGQQEYRADREAVMMLVPIDKLIEALKTGYTEIWQLCEYFDVDYKYIKLAYWIYFDKII